MNFRKNNAHIKLAVLFLVSGFLPLAAVGQQDVPFAGGVPVPPDGLADIPLGDGPWHYRTAENMDIRVELVTRMEYAMALEFLPDGSMLAATRRGILYQVEQDGSKREVSGIPPTLFRGESGSVGTTHGLADVKLHPDFAANRLVYLVYNKPSDDNPRGLLTIGRGIWNDGALENMEEIFGGDGSIAGVSRIAFGHDGKLFVTTTGMGDPQTLDNLAGKVLRLNDDGSVPDDNPFSNTPGARGEIYSYGHRGALGLTVHADGSLWQAENGPNGGDEINVIEAGKNYGWPVASLGRTYQGPWQSEVPSHTGYQHPIVYWMPAIAVSGILFYTGDALPAWKGDIFVGSLRTGEITGTGHLERILLNAEFEELRRESLLTDLHKRMRDVQQGPDEFIYVAIEEKDGGVLRIRPAD